ncbi:MAG: trmB [Gammaproteobacteria bacterium]|jgi:tRNA (guanine-N7-)-methyltransferase|nr:trmB [Gammaproteobacteria bacterium]
MNDVIRPRQVRSYVRRQARFTPGQKQALLELWPTYGLELTEQPLDYVEVFKRQAPIVLEIGFGMGTSLLEMAKAAPEKDFIGIEIHNPGVASLMRNLQEQNIANVRIFKVDAHDVLDRCIPDDSLTQVLLFFPDPWPKKKHHKRRIVQAEFVELIHRKLKTGGIFHLATDWQDYAKQMLLVMSEANGFINRAGMNNYAERPAHRPLTKFEARGQKLGHGVWDLIFAKN